MCRPSFSSTSQVGGVIHKWTLIHISMDHVAGEIPGVVDGKYSSLGVKLLLVSGLLAVTINISSYMIIGYTFHSLHARDQYTTLCACQSQGSTCNGERVLLWHGLSRSAGVLQGRVDVRPLACSLCKKGGAYGFCHNRGCHIGRRGAALGPQAYVCLYGCLPE